MTVAELIAKTSPALSDLRAQLVKARDSLIRLKAKFPDLAAEFDAQIADLEAKIAVLDSATTADGLAMLGIVVLQELRALPREGLKPHRHPSDLA